MLSVHQQDKVGLCGQGSCLTCECSKNEVPNLSRAKSPFSSMRSHGHQHTEQVSWTVREFEGMHPA